MFIGPCLAKRREALSEEVGGEVDQVMAFAELRQMLEEAGLVQADLEPSEFDSPHAGLAESEMCLPYSIEQLHRSVSELHVSHQELASAQEALMQSEKLASMGQLAAGPACSRWRGGGG